MVIRTGVILVVGLVLAGSAQTTRIPDVIPHPNPEIAEPMWVSASRAVTEDGDLDGQMLAESSKRNLEAVARKNQQAKVDARAESLAAVADCQIFTGRVVEHFRPNRSLDDLVAHADAVIDAKAVEVTQGFFNGTPGSLFRLDDVSWLRPFEVPVGEGPIFAFYPQAAIPTRNGYICAKAINSTIPPTVGDRLLIFPMIDAARTEAGTIIIAEPSREIVVNGERDGFRAPQFVKDAGGISWPELTRIVTAKVGRERSDQ
jgi:hypothetical protein